MELGGNRGGQFHLYVKSELDPRVGFKWGEKSELDHNFFKNLILVFKFRVKVWASIRFDWYGCPFACFVNHFLFIYLFIYSEQAQAMVLFLEMLKFKE
jgi:hypothetical protein